MRSGPALHPGDAEEAEAMEYDVIVIGSGQAGGPLAGAFAKAGRRTALVEREHVGGTCINEGCTPTKTMVASARVAHLVRRAADYGVDVPAPVIDMVRVRERKRDIVRSFRDGSVRRLESAGVDLIAGEARFIGGKTLSVNGRNGEHTLDAPCIVINTGARPARPRVPGADAVDVLDSTSIMELDRVPDHLLVVGGGYIGLEFAQMFVRFGARVTIVQRDGQLLPREDVDIAGAVAEILREDGVEVLLNAQPSRLDRWADDGARVTVAQRQDECTLDASHVLYAAGRVPNTDMLDLAAAGVETDAHGYIRVDGRLETTAPGVHAVGDVKGGPAFTHISYDDYRVLRTNLIDGGSATIADRLVPYTVFTDPQLGRVGLTEREARDAGRSVRVARMPMGHVARALETDESRGLMKVVVDAGTDRILGCAVLGIEGGETMSALQVAMMGDMPFTALRDGVFAHPTLAESFNNLFDAFDD